MSKQSIDTPPTEIEIAEIVSAENDACVGNAVARLAFQRDRLAEEVRRLRDERDMLEVWVRRTADSPELRSKHAGYHARRVNLEAGRLLCRLVEMRDAAQEPQKGGA